MGRFKLDPDEGAEYKEMYITLSNRVDDAIQLLIKAQQLCEEIYMAAGEESPDPPGEES